MIFETSGKSLSRDTEACLFEGTSTVVPANAGTHTPCAIVYAMRQMPSANITARGYGSPRSRGRPNSYAAISSLLDTPA
jgi:hypothetical protein